eukprot:CAMPEP_0196730644 /NCGR_PEP_ID=MMETSP1091-20130531/10652_1 /TAXON_ID=302021 /ORGANISM="Rhodomonas sp., Strain CCMP768" /LENGTH=267 /DNA_ID=CAMNT_0042073691 /DNA_START=12 /DNA_END=815 /DNA_ORIENTATION=+
MLRTVLVPSLLVMSLACCSAFSFTGTTPGNTHGLLRATSVSLRSGKTTGTVYMSGGGDRRVTMDRKLFVAALAAFTIEASAPPTAAQAEEEAVCNNMLGCNQPKTLAPPKKVYKDIFEEERELARQRDEAAEKERKEKLQGEFKALHGQFSAIQKGKGDLERDVKEILAKIGSGPGDDQSWDDVRRIARLYDTALRKDGMDPTMGRVKKLRLEFDRKAGDEFAKKLNIALKNIDKAGKKKDVPATAAALDEAVSAAAGWLALEPKTD